MTLREIVPSVARWWRRRIALRHAPSPADIARLKNKVEAAAKNHRERAHFRRALRHAVTARLAAEQGVTINAGIAS